METLQLNILLMHFQVSLENGTVSGFDIRAAKTDASGTKPSFTLHAHDKAVSSISYNPLIPNVRTCTRPLMFQLFNGLSNFFFLFFFFSIASCNRFYR